MEKEQRLWLESLLGWSNQKVREYRLPMLASLVFGFLAYGFHLTNKLINWDEVACLFSKGAGLTSGRWGLNILDWIFPNVSMPWIYGVITIVLMAVSVCILCRIFQIHSRLLQVLLAGSILAFPSLTSTMSYMFASSSYAIAFLMAVLAVLLMQKATKLSRLWALGCLVFSLSIYQAYVAVTASLLVLILIQRLLKGEDGKPVVRDGILYVLFLAVSMVIYYGVTQLLLYLTGQSLNSYAGGNMSLSLTDIPGKILLAYRRFLYYFIRTNKGLGLIPTSLSRILHFLLAAFSIVLLFSWILSRKKQKLPELLLLAALLGILPLAINCMFLFTTEDSIHTLVMYSFTTLYLLVLVLADLHLDASGSISGLIQRFSLEAVTLTIAAILISNVYLANEAALNLYLCYENSHSFFTSLAADLQMMPEFNEETQVAIVGEYQAPDFYRKNLSSARGLAGNFGFTPEHYSRNDFVKYYLGFPMNFASDEEVAAIMAQPEFAEMACYPYYGSMKFIGNTLVVKLS